MNNDDLLRSTASDHKEDSDEWNSEGKEKVKSISLPWNWIIRMKVLLHFFSSSV